MGIPSTARLEGLASARQVTGKAANYVRQGLQHIRRTPVMIAPLLIISVVVFLAIFSPLVAPFDPLDGSLSMRLVPPSWVAGGIPDHFFGSDTLGRDVLSRIIYGARISLSISLLAILIALIIGCVIGIVSGYYGGWLDIILMRLVDIFLSLPMILIALILAVLLGPSFQNVILILAVMTWPKWARQIRGETLAIKQRDFVALAKVAGCKPWVIMVRHIFPNVVPTLLVLTSLEFGHLIIVESSLSFLGVGIPPPVPSWGGMVAESRGLLATAWWLPILPGFCIFLSVLSMNSIGDWVRDLLDPKLRQV